MATTSSLTQLLKDNPSSIRVANPFKTMETLIFSRFRYDISIAKQIYEWVTFMHPRAKAASKVCHVQTHLMHLACEPAKHALVLWSKMKFHVLHTSWIQKDLRILLIGFIREVEATLESGLVKFFGTNADNPGTNCSLTFDDFCEFTIRCIDPMLPPDA